MIVEEQQGIASGGFVQIVFLELIADPGHRDEVQVEQIELIAVVMARVVPLISPAD